MIHTYRITWHHITLHKNFCSSKQTVDEREIRQKQNGYSYVCITWYHIRYFMKILENKKKDGCGKQRLGLEIEYYPDYLVAATYAWEMIAKMAVFVLRVRQETKCMMLTQSGLFRIYIWVRKKIEKRASGGAGSYLWLRAPKISKTEKKNSA